MSIESLASKLSNMDKTSSLYIKNRKGGYFQITLVTSMHDNDIEVKNTTQTSLQGDLVIMLLMFTNKHLCDVIDKPVGLIDKTDVK